MIPRQLEPEVMDSEEEARDYDAMDHTDVNRVFATDFLALYSESGPVLDVGTGTAQIPLELCRQRCALQIEALDAAAAMLRRARENIDRAGLGSRIHLVSADAKRMPFPDATFPAVISNSIVHHIPSPRDVLAEMARVVTPDGTLFVRDLLRPEDDHSVRRLVERYAGDANDHQRQMFDASLRAALTVDEIRAWVGEMGFDRNSVRQTSDRHWTWAMHGKRERAASAF